MIKELEVELKQGGYVIEESQVLVRDGLTYWHSTILDKDKYPRSGGFGFDRLQARKIAIAEYLERKEYSNLKKSDLSTIKSWGLDLIPTACGFAAGFDLENTIKRSVAESAERWVMSKWIDENYIIENIPHEVVLKELDPISLFFISHFDKVLFYKKNVEIKINGVNYKFDVVQTMAIKGQGIFPGSSSKKPGESIWQHSLLESFRHYSVFKNNISSCVGFPGNKVKFFGSNVDVALSQINKANNNNWPIPEVLIHTHKICKGGHYFLARTILDGWTSWEKGPLERFLY